VKGQTEYLSSIANCIYDLDQYKLAEFNDLMFGMDIAGLGDKDAVWSAVESMGLDRDLVEECAASDRSAELVARQFAEIQKTGIYGTPLVFVNGEPVVGPKPFRVYKRLLR
jgi:protein-disulfide isomerase